MNFSKILLGIYFFFAVLINTLGLIHGFLRPIAAVGGFFFLGAMVWGSLRFAKIIKNELGKSVLILWAIAFIAQLFWALLKAPLDVDGLFYHLPIILEALDKNQWNAWELPLWHVQNTPKMGEIPNLCLIALGGSSGWRLAQVGNFFSGLLGTFALYEIGKKISFKKPALYSLLFFLAPIAIKQMGTNYVDITSWSTWLAAASAILYLPLESSVFALGAAVFLHSGVKISGSLTSLSLLPLLWINTRMRAQKTAVFLGCISLSCMTWMIPNLIAHGNPVYPIHFPVPKEMGISTDFRFATFFPKVPRLLLQPLQFVLPEPIALYDQGGGAWGFAAILIVLVGIFTYVRKSYARKKKTRPTNYLLNYFLLSLALQYLLMPAREIPRHGFLGGWTLVTLFWTRFENFYEGSQWIKKAFFWILLIQALYLIPDRTIFRGANTQNAPAVIYQNFRDIISFGEPQHPDRWLHFPYVPILRKNEPRTARIDDLRVDLLALYWGRHFSNQVVLDPRYCRWPYCETR